MAKSRLPTRSPRVPIQFAHGLSHDAAAAFPTKRSPALDGARNTTNARVPGLSTFCLSRRGGAKTDWLHAWGLQSIRGSVTRGGPGDAVARNSGGHSVRFA